jgi:hypothetical protein
MLIGVSVSNDPATFRDLNATAAGMDFEATAAGMDFKATAAGMNESLDVLRGRGVGTARRTCAFNLSDRLRALDAVKSVQEHEGEPS